MEFPRSLFALPFVLACTSGASFGAVNTVKFTASALGLGSGSTEINEGSTIESDIAGKLVTGSATGSGTTLFVQRRSVHAGGAGPASLLGSIFQNFDQIDVCSLTGSSPRPAMGLPGPALG